MYHKPRDATRIIKVLNSNTKYELEEFNIEDRIEFFLELRKVLTNNNSMLQLENKCHNLEVQIKKFHMKFNALH